MDRRSALKGIGLSFGYLVATPMVASLMQSCRKQDPINWKPVFFTDEEAGVLTKITDLILPATEELPGALDVHTPQFYDAFIDAVYKPEDQEKIKKGIKAIIKALKSNGYDYKRLLDTHLTGKSKEKVLTEILSEIRSTSVWAYMTSERIGEQVLAYDPVPGVYLSCIPVEEATGGKAWAIPK